jgi:streptogramin lyase
MNRLVGLKAANMALLVVFLCVGLGASAQQIQYPKQADLPNPYKLVENWPTLPAGMNGGRWGELIRADIDPKGNVWVFHRCFNTEPAGYATCVGRAEPPILEFDPSGKLLTSFGSGMFAFPHGFTIDREGNIWASDANNAETVLGISAKDANGVVRGHQV